MNKIIAILILFLSLSYASDVISPGTYNIFPAFMGNSAIQKIEITFNKDSSYFEKAIYFGVQTDMTESGRWYQHKDTIFYTIIKICFFNKTPSCTTYSIPAKGFYCFVDAIKDTQFYFESGFLKAMKISDAKKYYRNQKYRDIHLLAITPMNKKNETIIKAK